MPNRAPLTLATLIAAGPLLAAAVALGAPPVDYARQVKPVLAERCFSCHGALQQLGNLRLDTAQLIRKGGARGPAVVPGKPDASLLVRRVTEALPRRMPPEGEALKPEEVAALKAWITAGAPGVPGEKPEEDPNRHWSFQPVRRPAVPRVSDPRFPVRSPIDAFVLAKLKEKGFSPAPPAAPETLLRRVYLDLTGLPPTREELQAFLADRGPGAYEKVVDRLLASPAYGERWGRHWMDVWRYSDWYGRRDQNDVRNSYGQIWRWRDWIVRSLNEDRGYDRMVTEMLAGDEVAPEDEGALAATGFLVRNWYSLNYNQWMRDNVEHTGKAFLGLTLNCAHCHDHKYDPISQKEYFRFRAFFEPLELRHDRVAGEPDPGPFKKYIYGGSTTPLKTGMIRIFDERPDAKTLFYRGGDERNTAEGEPPLLPGAPAFLGGDRLRVQPVTLPAPAAYPGLKPWVREEERAARRKALANARAAGDAARIAAAEAELTSLEARIAADDARYGQGCGDTAALARAASRAERQAALRAAEWSVAQAERALADARAKGAPEGVQKAEAALAAARTAAEKARGGMAAESAEYTPLSPVYPTASTGRRKALAEWITSSRNPLTPRVAVNHIWMRHFGRPLVDSVFDFGRNGKRPSHPELLDWLAAVFAAPSSATRGPGSKDQAAGAALSPGSPGMSWRMKALHRLIVTSSTYRMASEWSAPAGGPAAVRHPRSVDPENRFLWRYNARRAEAEVVRDSILASGGALDRTLGGPELDNRTENAPRRSLYYSVYAEDGGAMRFLAAFDAPDPCDCYRRGESMVPQQALAMTNSRLIRDQGRLLARKLWESLGAAADRDSAFITAAFEQVLTRRPRPAELSACREFLRQQAELFRSSPAPGAPADGGLAPAPDPALRAGESLVQALYSHADFATLR